MARWATLRGAMRVSAAAIIVVMTASATSRPVAAVRPNIIVILADDLGYGDVSTYLKGRFSTPNIDRIGREGVVFRQGYVSAPICSPSRAALMTGRHQQRFGFEFNNGPSSRDAREHLGLDPKEVTIAEVLRTAGYRTGLVGKWHLGSNDEHYPTNRGFDYFWGFLTGQTNFIRPTAPDAVNAFPPRAVAAAAQAAADATTPGAVGTGEITQPYAVVGKLNAVITGPARTPVDLGDGYLTEMLADQAIGFIDGGKDKPFFLYLAQNAPHTPLQTTNKYYDRFPNIQNRSARVYAGMVSALDDSIGKILTHLDRTGLAKNTIVVFLSDNGCAAYIADICSPEPLRGGKLTYDEGGVRVPFMLRWPGHVRPGTDYGRPVSSRDVFPTLVAAAGLPLPTDRPHDGFDLMAQLASATPFARPPMFWRTQPIEAMLDDDWKYTRDLDGKETLYNIRNDPKEKLNVIKANAARVATMRTAYNQWASAMHDPLWTGRYEEYVFDGRTYKFKP